MNDGGNRGFGGTNAFDKPSNPFGRDFPSSGRPSFGAPSAFGAVANASSAFGATSFGGGAGGAGSGGGGFGTSMFGSSSNTFGVSMGAPTGFQASSPQPAFGTSAFSASSGNPVSSAFGKPSAFGTSGGSTFATASFGDGGGEGGGGGGFTSSGFGVAAIAGGSDMTEDDSGFAKSSLQPGFGITNESQTISSSASTTTGGGGFGGFSGLNSTQPTSSGFSLNGATSLGFAGGGFASASGPVKLAVGNAGPLPGFGQSKPSDVVLGTSSTGVAGFSTAIGRENKVSAIDTTGGSSTSPTSSFGTINPLGILPPSQSKFGSLLNQASNSLPEGTELVQSPDFGSKVEENQASAYPGVDQSIKEEISKGIPVYHISSFGLEGKPNFWSADTSPEELRFEYQTAISEGKSTHEAMSHETSIFQQSEKRFEALKDSPNTSNQVIETRSNPASSQTFPPLYGVAAEISVHKANNTITSSAAGVQGFIANSREASCETELSEEDLKQYEAHVFTYRKVPEIPPPERLCF